MRLLFPSSTLMNTPDDSLDAAFAALRTRQTGDSPAGMVDAVMARVSAPYVEPFPVGALAAAAVACMVAALSAVFSLAPEESPEPPPALAIFRADTVEGRPFMLP